MSDFVLSQEKMLRYLNTVSQHFFLLLSDILKIENKLENLGYARKGINPSDKQSSLIYVTEKVFALVR